MHRSAADRASVATTASTLRGLADATCELARSVELGVFRPGMAEAVEEWAAKLRSLADDPGAGGTIAALDLLHELAIVHGYFGNQLGAAVRPAARGSE